MALTLHSEFESGANPIDRIEEFAAARDWSCERQSAEELAIHISGAWCEYFMWFIWRDELGALYFTCGLDMRVPDERRTAVYPLLAKLNERMWLGHFELWSDEGLPSFRHTMLVNDDAGIETAAVGRLVDTAVGECDRFYPAFQFVIWGGKSAGEAIDAALLEPVGEA